MPQIFRLPSPTVPPTLPLPYLVEGVGRLLERRVDDLVEGARGTAEMAIRVTVGTHHTMGDVSHITSIYLELSIVNRENQCY